MSASGRCSQLSSSSNARRAVMLDASTSTHARPGRSYRSRRGNSRRYQLGVGQRR